MAYKYIVLGTRSDKTTETLADPSLDDAKQKSILEKHIRNEEFAEVQRFMLMPHTRAHHPAATLKMEADIKASEEAEKKSKKKI